MLKRFFRYGPIAAVILAISVFLACHKDSPSFTQTDPAAPMSIGLAENYFYNNLIKQPGSFYPATTPGGKPNWKYVLFKKGYASQTPTTSFVEIPLLYNQRPSLLITATTAPTGVTQQGSAGKIADNTTPGSASGTSPGASSISRPMAGLSDVDRLNGTFDRLLIYKNKATNKINQYIVTYVPDQDYLQRHHNDASHNTITKLDPDFNGYILYRSWDDKLQFSLRIQNGVSAKTTIYESNPTPGLLSRSASPGIGSPRANTSTGATQKKVADIICITQYVYHYQQMCYYTVTEEGTFEDCGDWELTGVDVYQDCYDDGSGAPPPTPNPPPAPPSGGGSGSTTPPDPLGPGQKICQGSFNYQNTSQTGAFFLTNMTGMRIEDGNEWNTIPSTVFSLSNGITDAAMNRVPTNDYMGRGITPIQYLQALFYPLFQSGDISSSGTGSAKQWNFTAKAAQQISAYVSNIASLGTIAAQGPAAAVPGNGAAWAEFWTQANTLMGNFMPGSSVVQGYRSNGTSSTASYAVTCP